MDFKKPEADNLHSHAWSEDEEERLLELFHEKDLSIADISGEFEDRSTQSIKNKLRKLRKKNGTYNYTHQEEKYKLNRKWIKKIANSDNLRIFDGYAGSGGSTEIYLPYAKSIDCCEIEENTFKRLVNNFSSTKIEEIEEKNYSSSVDETELNFHNENVNRVLHRKYGDYSTSYDFIDLDPCGSPFTSLPQAIRLIKNGHLAVTFGDLQLQRWNRPAPLMKAYRMPETNSTLETVEYMIGWAMFEGVRQEEANQVRKLEVKEVESLPDVKTGVVRVLFKVEKRGALNPVLNYLSKTLEGVEENNPLAAKYPLNDKI